MAAGSLARVHAGAYDGFAQSRRKSSMKKALSVLVTLALAAWPLTGALADTKEQSRLENCGMVLHEIMNVPDNIPANLVDKAECVIVFPSVLKGGFIVGGALGRGAMICRSGEHFNGPWGTPLMMALEGGSVGFQIGGEATDFVILVMNNRGATAILKDKVKLGADLSASAGPKGRDASAETDATLRAEMLTYSRSRGLFAGVSLEGSTVRPDKEANEELYQRKIDPADIVLKGVVPPPAAAQEMIETLTKFSPRNDSDPNSLK
jgi:SH3 domain-containing YSC84-like protein 1